MIYIVAYPMPYIGSEIAVRRLCLWFWGVLNSFLFFSLSYILGLCFFYPFF